VEKFMTLATNAIHSQKASFKKFWADLRTEFLILIGSVATTETRLRHWISHVNTYVGLKDTSSVGQNVHEKEEKTHRLSIDDQIRNVPFHEWKTERIDFAIKHLDILDGKFGFLLAVQAFLAAGVGFAVSAFPWEKLTKPTDRLLYLSRSFWLIFVVSSVIIWLINVIISLFGMHRIIWGHMWRYERLQEAEWTQVLALLVRIVKRTARFRVAIVLTMFGVLWGAVLTFAIIFTKAGFGSVVEDAVKSRITDGGYEIVNNVTGVPPSVSPKSLGSDGTYEILTSIVHANGHLSHSHTFLLNQRTGDVWEMKCRKGQTVEFRTVPKEKKE
jgi:hypothetical protein